MKNKFFALFTILLSISLIITYSCKKEKDKSVSVTKVGLNKTSTTLIEGETETLVATVMPENATDKSVVWESDNESAATVSQEGPVTAVGEGKATITVKTNDGGFSASCKVTVNKKVIAVTGVKLSAASMTFREGDKGTLTATVEPANATNKNVEWWTSDLDVVSVISTSGGSKGYVEARKAGKATVTVKTEDGEFSASCEITVEKKEVPVTGISIEPSSLKLPAGDTYSLIPHVQPSDATNQNIKWLSTNESVATVNAEGKVTAVAAGSAEIRAMLEGKFATCPVEVDDVKMTMKKTSYMVILSLSKKINIESDIETNFTLDKSKITVISADPLIATVDQDLNLVAPGKIGKARITLNYRYGNGLLSTSFMVTVKKNLKD
ncbi:ig domain protein group 2 domain protein [Bacteroides sp. CAG:770]|nr:ig domain protein group 2 domain protein [Bacteroides sp. CAG:770]